MIADEKYYKRLTYTYSQQRLPARLHNCRCTVLKMGLKAPVGIDGKPPAGFPSTRGEFEHITSECSGVVMR